MKTILGLSARLPLKRDASARYLPWLMAFMVYLAGLAIASLFAVENIAARWHEDLAGQLTIEVPDGNGNDSRVDAILALLQATPGIAEAHRISDDEINRLLAPWVGPDAAKLDLPLPALIAVTRKTDMALDRGALEKKLMALAPGVRLDDHQQWVGSALIFLDGVETTAAAICLFVLLIAVLSVIFVTRTRMAIHHRVIGILHLIGAEDLYIARQFQRQAWNMGFWGGVLGAALAVGTIFGFSQMIAATLPGMNPGRSMPFSTNLLLYPLFGLVGWQWMIIAFLPLASAFIARIAARKTVLGTLAKAD